jgi:hypothetical protein
MNSIGCFITGLIILAILSIVPLIIMWLWNWLMPYLFNLPEINFWMALGISILTGLIFRQRTVE